MGSSLSKVHCFQAQKNAQGLRKLLGQSAFQIEPAQHPLDIPGALQINLTRH